MILIQNGPSRKKFHSEQEGWFMPSLIPNGVHADTHSDCFFLALVKLSSLPCINVTQRKQKYCSKSTAYVHFKLKGKSTDTKVADASDEENVWCTASGRVEEEYRVGAATDFYFFFQYFWKIRHLCTCQNMFILIKAMCMYRHVMVGSLYVASTRTLKLETLIGLVSI